MLSTFILFQYELNETKDYRKEFPFEIRNEKFCLAKQNGDQCRLFNAFKLLNNIINGILFVFLNIFIDIFLIKVFGESIKLKFHMEFNRSKVEEYKKKIKNLTKMVIVNGVIYFLSYIVELTVTIMLIVFSERIFHFCSEKISCDLIKEEAEFFIVFSMMANFCILKTFNKNFDESFKNLKMRSCLLLLKR